MKLRFISRQAPQAMKELLLSKLDPAIAIRTEDFLSEATDLRAELSRLSAEGANGLVVLTQTEQSASIVVKQVRQLNLAFTVYGSNAMSSSVFIGLAGEAAEGVIIASLPATDDVLTSEGKNILKEFHALYGPLNSVDFAFYCSVESFRALQLAVESGSDPLKFLSTHEFEGIFGKYSFDSNGDLVGLKPTLRIIKAGAFRRLQ